MQIIPWSQIRSWRCIACGVCCRNYDVVLKIPEWLNIVKTFGVDFTAPTISNFLLRRKTNGSCVFLYEKRNMSFCCLQHTKPQACKLWPFKVSDSPRFGNSNKSAYQYHDQKLFVYADSACLGLRYGEPAQELMYSIIPEFIEIALGRRRQQYKSTASF